MVLLQLMKRMDERLDFIENELLSGTSINSNQEITKNEDKYLSIEEVSVILGLAKATIYSKVCRKELPHMKKDKRLFYTFSNTILKSKKLLANVKSYGVVKETGIILPFIHALFVKAKSII